MSTAVTLTPQLPPPSQSQLLPLTNVSNTTTTTTTKRSSESPHSMSSKTSGPVPCTPSPVHQATTAAQQRESLPEVTMKSPPSQMLSKASEDRKAASPPPAPAKLPDLAPPAAGSPKEPLVSPPLAQHALITRNASTSPSNRNNNNSSDYVSNTASEQAPAQLALLLSQALADADALRRELASERKRVARAERLLAALQAPSSPSSVSTGTDVRNNDGRLPESAAKAILDADTRAEKAERARDDALHALSSLTASFAELDRYEAACALRVSDARGAFSRLLTSISNANPPPQPSSGASNTPPRDELRLNLPRVPAPLPSLPPAIHLPGPGSGLAPPPPAPSQSSRYTRSLQPLPTYGSIHSPIDARQANAFDSLPLPPPPAATGLASINTSLPVKRSHSHRSRAEELEYEDQKRRRLTHEMDVDVAGPDANSVYARSSRHYQSGPPSAQPLSAHPSALPPLGSGPSPPLRVYDRTSSAQYGYPPSSAPNYQRENVPPYAPPPSGGSRYPVYDDREREYVGRDGRDTASGMVRIDARELVREAKARERRGRERESYVRHPQPESHLHPQSQGEPQVGGRPRGRSSSRSSSRSKSSMSLDEMLLETATDGGRDRPSPEDASGQGGARQTQGYGAAPAVNGAGTAGPPSASHPVSKAPSTHAPATNGVGRKTSIPASQLMTLGPSGTIVSGGGSDTPPAVDPAVRFPGLRTCRQCLQPGRYKDGKCVEKWGPGPQGPGTVCDRCRKKMKRVERRGTLDSSASMRANNIAAQSQQSSQKVSQPTLSLAPSQSSYSQSYSQSQSSQSQSQSQSQSGRGRAPPPPGRTDTVIVDGERHVSDPSRSSRSPSHGSPNYHASVPPVSAAARHPSLASQAHYVTPHTQSQSSQSQSQHHHHAQSSRRAPTPPFITAIPSREQHEARHAAEPSARRAAAAASIVAGADSDDDLQDEDDRDRRSVAGGRYAHSESYARQHVGERDERDELADDADGDAEGDADADADGSGAGSAEADAEDADILDAVDATMKVEEN